jgi:hypothetical protein
MQAGSQQEVSLEDRSRLFEHRRDAVCHDDNSELCSADIPWFKRLLGGVDQLFVQ